MQYRMNVGFQEHHRETFGMNKLSIHLQQLRSTLFSCGSLTNAECIYLDARWNLIENFLRCASVSELALKLEISKCSEKFQLIDYVAIILGYCCQTAGGLEYVFEFPVIIEMIDDHKWFDNAFRNTKFLRILVNCCSTSSCYYLGTRKAPRKILSHIAKKFPSVKKLGLMYVKRKGGNFEPRFSEEDLKKWF